MSLSRLEAVNQMLVAVGESVILVEIEGAGDYANCSAVLDQVTKAVLAKDWQFNTETRTFTPDENGEIALAPEILKIDPVRKIDDYVQRQGKLYDRQNTTFVFTEPVQCKVTLYFSFEDCPYHVQQKIVADAAAKYQKSYVGSTTSDKFLQQDRAEAGADTEDAESTVDNYNILTDNPDMQWLHRRTFTNGTI